MEIKHKVLIVLYNGFEVDVSIHVYYLCLRLINAALIILIEFFCFLITKTIRILEGSQHVISLDIWTTDCIVSHAMNYEWSTMLWRRAKHQQYFSLKAQHSWLFKHHCLENWETQKFYWYDDYWLKWLYLLSFIGWWLTSLKILLFLKSILILFGVHMMEREQWWAKRRWIFFLIN